MTAAAGLAQAALAAFMVADAEHQSALAGVHPTLDTWRPIVKACGVEMARMALRVRGEMHLQHANDLDAYNAIQEARRRPPPPVEGAPQ